MSEIEIIWKSLNALESWIKKERYRGWDPYDGLKSEVVNRMKLRNPYIYLAFLHLNKLLPINLRKFLKIEKGFDPQSISLFIESYILLYQITQENKYKKKAFELYKLLMKYSLVKKTGYHSWGTPFRVVMSDYVYSPEEPGIINTSLAMKALSLLYALKPKKKIKKNIISSQEFLRDIMFHQEGDLSYFLYRPGLKNKIVPNGSAKALEAITYSFNVNYDESIHAIADKVFKSLLRLQLQDGSWPYAIYHNGRTYMQLDFHQGYIIDGVVSYYTSYSSNRGDKKTTNSIYKAIEFYEKMFLPSGQSYYRYPKLYPTDILNQAQGVITFSKVYKKFGEYRHLTFAKKIALWTINNMQDRKGYFYYQKGRFITNKIPYIRWAQAWMMLALTKLLKEHFKKYNGRVYHEKKT